MLSSPTSNVWRTAFQSLDLLKMLSDAFSAKSFSLFSLRITSRVEFRASHKLYLNHLCTFQRKIPDDPRGWKLAHPDKILVWVCSFHHIYRISHLNNHERLLFPIISWGQKCVEYCGNTVTAYKSCLLGRQKKIQCGSGWVSRE